MGLIVGEWQVLAQKLSLEFKFFPHPSLQNEHGRRDEETMQLSGQGKTGRKNGFLSFICQRGRILSYGSTKLYNNSWVKVYILCNLNTLWNIKLSLITEKASWKLNKKNLFSSSKNREADFINSKTRNLLYIRELQLYFTCIRKKKWKLQLKHKTKLSMSKQFKQNYWGKKQHIQIHHTHTYAWQLSFTTSKTIPCFWCFRWNICRILIGCITSLRILCNWRREKEKQF